MGAVAGFAGIGGKGTSFDAQTANVIDPTQAAAKQNAGAQAATDVVTNTADMLAPSSSLGLGRQNQVYGQMQQLASQLGQQAQGQGPNPAQAALAQQTGNNVAATTAAMAGARGAAANPGLIAREAAQQGAATQQSAVGQSATLQANQQISAEQQLQQQQAQLAALGTTQVNQGINAANVGASAAQALANNTAAQTNAYNTANIQNASQANSANAGVQGTAAKGFGDTSAAFASTLAEGGVVGVDGQPKHTSSRYLRGMGHTADNQIGRAHV